MKAQPTDDLMDYFYEIKSIAGEGGVEDDAIIQYVIEGIQDDERSKVLLLRGHNTVRT